MKISYPKKINSNRYYDNRGFFQEFFKKKKFGFDVIFTANSFSKKNVIRGLHIQLKKKQEIFLTVNKGKIFDVCVDVNPKSKYFSKVYINKLKEGDMLYIPKFFAHGFAALQNENLITYNFSNYRDKNSEIGIKFDDKDLNIKWPIKKAILSKKDRSNVSFSNFLKILKF